MTLYHATTVLPGAAAAEALCEALEAADPAPSVAGRHDLDDGSGLWEISAYFEGRPDAVALDLLAVAHGGGGFSVATVGSRDWMAQVRATLTPVSAGRYVVFGSHDRARIATNRIGLEIEAALAFGTGHHATTQGCLLALDALVRAGFRPGRVADIGCGTAVLAMAAARSFPGRVLASDIDPLATATARDNVRANRLGGRVRVLTAPGFADPVLRRSGPLELIFANILAAPLKRLAPAMASQAAPGGIVVLAGILHRQASGVEALYRGWGFRRLRVIRRDGWTILVLRRRARRPVVSGGRGEPRRPGSGRGSGRHRSARGR